MFGATKHLHNTMNYIYKTGIFPARQITLLAITIILLFYNNINALAISDPASQLEQAGIKTKLGSSVDLNIQLIDSLGSNRTLGSLLSEGKPLILVPVYYKCPRLCGILLGGFSQLIKELDLKLGADFKVVTFSFNEKEGIVQAAQKKAEYTAFLS